MRLRDFLAERLGISGRKAKQILDDRRVFVNRRRVWMAHHTLQRGDVVEVAGTGRETHAAPSVLFQDAHYLVVTKPTGTLSNGPGSLEEELRRSLEVPALRAVHRLDRDTSGCLWYAKSEKARLAAIELFRNNDVRKSYQAIVTGKIPARTRTLASSLDGQQALTDFRVLDVGSEATHIRVRLQTGRTHQIRRHLSSAGHPVLGDRRYWGSTTHTAATMRVPRQMLHASRLSFKHPLTGKPISVSSPLPPDFKTCLNRFGLK